MKLTRTFFAALLVIVCLSGVTFAQSVLIDDANTSNLPKDLDTNFGTNPNLTVAATNTAYLKFKLSPALPAGTEASQIAKATLKIYVGNVSTPGTIEIRRQPSESESRGMSGSTETILRLGESATL